MINAFRAQTIYSPQFSSPQGDLALSSHGKVALSVPGSSCALELSSDIPSQTVDVSSGDKNLQIRAPVFNMAGEELLVSASELTKVYAGEAPERSELELSKTTGITSGTFSSDNYGRLHSPPSTSVHPTIGLSRNNSDRLASLRTLETGRLVGRGSSHTFNIASEPILELVDGKVTIYKDVDILGVLNNIDGTMTYLNIEDPVVRLSRTTATEGDTSSESTGISIETVPATAGDVPYMERFKSSDGSSLFVDQGAVNVEKAAGSKIFDKKVAHVVGQGAKLSGGRSASARLDGPAWEVQGGSIRLERFTPGASGEVTRYVMNMRVTDDGSFEISRIKVPMAFDVSTGKHVESGTPQFSVMQQCLVA